MHGTDSDTNMVRVLGPVTVCGQSVTRRQQAIVSALACLGPAGGTADRVIDAVWSDSVPRSARASLQNHVARMRSRFGPDTIHTLDHGYRLGLPTDVEVFEQAVAQALAVGVRPEAVDLLERARDLWRGSPYESLGGASAEIARSRLEAMRAEALDHLALCRMALGDLDTALAELGVLVREDPYRERRWEMMMRCFHLAGRRAEALATFDRLSRRLLEDLGVGPSHDLMELEQQIRASGEHIGGSHPVAGRVAAS